MPFKQVTFLSNTPFFTSHSPNKTFPAAIQELKETGFRDLFMANTLAEAAPQGPKGCAMETDLQEAKNVLGERNMPLN